jgi:hypothetical protein
MDAGVRRVSIAVPSEQRRREDGISGERNSWITPQNVGRGRRS